MWRNTSSLFTRCSAFSIAENLQYEEALRKEENQKIRYLGFGIRFQKDFIYRQGGRPVIYDDKDEAKKYLPTNEWWRIVKLDLFKFK